MTRETKIGLLVGLGFIVVFAVLLSHTGNVPPPGETMTPGLAQNTRGIKPVLSGDMRSEIGRPDPIPPVEETFRPVGSGPAADPLISPRQDRMVHLDDLPGFADLPAPPSLEPSITTLAQADSRRGESGTELPLSIAGIRSVPPEADLVPRPSTPAEPPTQTPRPDTSAPELVAGGSGNKVAPPQTSPKEYVIQGGDSLARIAQKHYKSADQRVIQFLVKSNEGRIKDANTIMEGQKLLIPELPPEMFEASVQLAGAAVSMEDFMNNPSRTGTASGRGTSTRTEPAPRTPPAQQSVKPEPAKPEPAKTSSDSAIRMSIGGLQRVQPGAGTVPPKDLPKTNNAADKPKAATDSKAAGSKSAKAANEKEAGDQLYRWYEVKPNDTLGSISRRELGSSQHWQEIRKLNGNVDPQKMKVGDRIKLPRKPVSTSSESGRPSA